MSDEPPPSRIGLTLALAVGVSCLLGAVAVAATGGGGVVATVLALVGASALAGWLRARRRGR